MTEPAARLAETVEKFCAFIESLPESAFKGQDWGPQEVLAHLVYWHEVYLEQARGSQSGTPVEVPHGRYVDLNDHAVQLGRETPTQALVARFRLANDGLLEIYADCDPERIVVPVKRGARSYTLAELVPVVESHVRGHHMQLKRDFIN